MPRRHTAPPRTAAATSRRAERERARPPAGAPPAWSRVASLARHPAFGCALVAFLLYLPGLGGGFLRDDHFLIEHHPYLRAGGWLGRLLLAEIGKVPPVLRGVLIEAEIRRAPMQDIADRLGITVEAVKSRLHRARKELRRRLERHTGRLGLATLTA